MDEYKLFILCTVFCGEGSMVGRDKKTSRKAYVRSKEKIDCCQWDVSMKIFVLVCVKNYMRLIVPTSVRRT